MMATLADAYNAAKAVLAGATSLPIRYQGDVETPLPDTPEAFCFAMIEADQPQIASFGGGRGANTYRTYCSFIMFVFVPSQDGALTIAMGDAETIAAAFRGYRDGTIFCTDAGVRPIGPGSSVGAPGSEAIASASDAYFCVAVDVTLFFDQLG